MIERLARALPELTAGYDTIRAQIDRDGALPAAVKHLLLAAAAAARNAPELTAESLARARARGADEAQIAVCAGALLLTRGEAACGRMLAADAQQDGAVSQRAPSELDAESYFLTYNGLAELPARLRRLAELAPDAFEGYFRMHHAVLSADPRTDPIAELALVTINTAELQESFAAIHAAAARRRGISDEELVEAVLCAVPVAGVAAWAAGAAALFPQD